VHDAPYSEEAVSSVPHVPYEFPNGFNDEYGHERFKIPEALFDPNSKEAFLLNLFVLTSVQFNMNEPSVILD
jgi:actin-related protein